MTNLPTNLVPTLLRIINDNRRGTIMHDSSDVRTVRDMLVLHGHIELTVDYVDSDADARYAQCTELADCDDHVGRDTCISHCDGTEDCLCDMCEG